MRIPGYSNVYEFSYVGLVNQQLEAFGFGIATGDVCGEDWTWTGTFYKNKLHGLSKNFILQV